MERAVPDGAKVIASMSAPVMSQQLRLRDFPQLSAGNLPTLSFVRFAGTRLDTSRFSAEQLPEAFW